MLLRISSQRSASSHALNFSSSPRMVTKHFLITGAGRGIGRGLSRLLLQTGHRVLLVDNNSLELENTASILAKSNRRKDNDYATIKCDLRKPDEIKQVARKAEQLFGGRLDCLINNAACWSFHQQHPQTQLIFLRRYRRCWWLTSLRAFSRCLECFDRNQPHGANVDDASMPAPAQKLFDKDTRRQRDLHLIDPSVHERVQQ